MDFLISIIVPVYNIERDLPRCLDSILNQTYKNLEIIVIDDGSTDNSKSVIRDYASRDHRIVPVFRDNAGVSATRNYGLSIANGDFIGFVDGDDFIEPEIYSVLLDNAIKYSADISHCGFQIVFSSTRVKHFYNSGRLLIHDHLAGIYQIISGQLVEPSMCNKLYRKTCLKDFTIPPGLEINEDLLFNFYAFVHSRKSVFLDKSMYHYIKRSHSASSTLRKDEHFLFDPCRVRNEIFNYCLENLDKESQTLAYKSCLFNLIRLSYYIEKNHLVEFRERFFFYKTKLSESKFSYSLSKKNSLLEFLFFYFPKMLNYLYKVNYKYFSKRKYE